MAAACDRLRKRNAWGAAGGSGWSRGRLITEKDTLLVLFEVFSSGFLVGRGKGHNPPQEQQPPLTLYKISMRASGTCQNMARPVHSMARRCHNLLSVSLLLLHLSSAGAAPPQHFVYRNGVQFNINEGNGPTTFKVPFRSPSSQERAI